MRFKIFIVFVFFYQEVSTKIFIKNFFSYFKENKKNIIIQLSIFASYDIIYIRGILNKNLEKKRFFKRSNFSILTIVAPYSILKIIDLLKTKNNTRKKIKNSLISISSYLSLINLLNLKY